jgi:parvulin-like peptidyl-prolyl isomerase
VAGRKISSDEVVSRLKLAGEWYGALDELSDEAELAQAAKQEGVSVTDAELQEEFDAYRISRGLEKADETKSWLKSTGLAVEDVEAFLEAGILRRKLAAKVIGDKEIEAYYKQNPREFEFARISHLVVNDEGAAEELALSAREEGEDFADLAREHSVDTATRCGGGYVGLLTRLQASGIPEDAADRIFAASVGDVVGPFPSGSGHCLVHVLEAGKRPLDDGLKSSLRAKLFGGWLAKRAGG